MFQCTSACCYCGGQDDNERHTLFKCNPERQVTNSRLGNIYIDYVKVQEKMENNWREILSQRTKQENIEIRVEIRNTTEDGYG